MNEPLVSIIIPMYNAAKTITRCVQSVQAQTHKQLEIIVIDDGSIDHGGDLVEELAKNDQRIQLKAKKNSGPSMARNDGICLAKGKYIQFVDADDWIEATMVATLLTFMTTTNDLVICGYQKEQRTIRPTIIGQYTRLAWLHYIGMIYEQLLLASPCNKMYRHSIIKTAEIYFSPNWSLGEDLLFNLTYLNYCQ